MSMAVAEENVELGAVVPMYLTSCLRICHIEVPVLIEITKGDVAFQVSLPQFQRLHQGKNTPAIAKVCGNVVAGGVAGKCSRHDKVRDTIIVKVANFFTRRLILD